MEVYGQLYAPVALPPGEEAPEPVVYEAGGQYWFECREIEKCFAPVGNRNAPFRAGARLNTDLSTLDSLIMSPVGVTINRVLYWILDLLTTYRL
jgi:hypothetical protein